MISFADYSSELLKEIDYDKNKDFNPKRQDEALLKRFGGNAKWALILYFHWIKDKNKWNWLSLLFWTKNIIRI